MIKDKDQRLSSLDRALGIEIKKCVNCYFEFYVLRNQIYKHCPSCIVNNSKLTKEYEEKIKYGKKRK